MPGTGPVRRERAYDGDENNKVFDDVIRGSYYCYENEKMDDLRLLCRAYLILKRTLYNEI